MNWESMEKALKATEDMMSLPLCPEYFGSKDNDTMQMTHYILKQRYYMPLSVQNYYSFKI